MVDNVNPTTQFHPYQPQDAEPQTGNTPKSLSGLGGIISKLGINPDTVNAVGGSLKNFDYNGQIQKARTVAQKNPSLALGGLAALVIGAGLLRKRSTR